MQTDISDETQEELKNFQEDARRLMEEKINQSTSRVVSEKVIRPLTTMLLSKIAVLAQNKASGFIKQCWKNKMEKEIRNKAMNSIAKLKELKGQRNLTEQEKMEQTVHTENLTKLMEQTRCPKMMACLTRQNVPMNMAAVQTSIKVIEYLRQQEGNHDNFQINIINGDASCVLGDINGKMYTIDLSDNHFGDEVNSDNDCLYDALCKQFPELTHISRSEFRSKIADVIEFDPEIANVINQGWHEFSSSKGFYGGAKKKLEQPQSTQFLESSKKYNILEKFVFDETNDCDIKYDFERDFKHHKKIAPNEKENIMMQLALNKALERINKELGSNKLNFKDFEVTMYCKVEMRMEDDVAGYAYYPVEMVKEIGGKKYSINVDNPIQENREKTGNGPQVSNI